jgi:hypothetical protein
MRYPHILTREIIWFRISMVNCRQSTPGKQNTWVISGAVVFIGFSMFQLALQASGDHPP